MHKKFLSYINSESLFSIKDKILVAVSGGMDSMTLAEMMRINQFNFAIAHFNHLTRNGESDLDEAFVKDYAAEKDIPFYSTQVDISAIIEKNNGGNFQNIARMQRYRWLEELRQTLGYQFIATAHHHNDQIETFLFHFSRGTGLDGLTGISARQMNIVRPMLTFTRSDIEKYVYENKLAYRVDSSNSSSKYSRNYIRHGIIPSFKILNPQFEGNANKTIDNLRSAKALYQHLLDEVAARHITTTDKETIKLSRKAFQKQRAGINQQLCFELIRPYGFNFAQVRQIMQAWKQRGKTFYSEEYVLLIEKNDFIIKKNEQINRIHQEISEDCTIPGFGTLYFEKADPDSIIKGNPNIEFVDADKLDFPLLIRNREDGDRFNPLGMSGRSKKLKDFFTDLKLNKFDKDQALVLLHQNKVVWVLGYRLSDKFKITAKTTNILKMIWEPIA